MNPDKLLRQFDRYELDLIDAMKQADKYRRPITEENENRLSRQMLRINELRHLIGKTRASIDECLGADFETFISSVNEQLPKERRVTVWSLGYQGSNTANAVIHEINGKRIQDEDKEQRLPLPDYLKAIEGFRSQCPGINFEFYLENYVWKIHREADENCEVLTISRPIRNYVKCHRIGA